MSFAHIHQHNPLKHTVQHSTSVLHQQQHTQSFKSQSAHHRQTNKHHHNVKYFHVMSVIICGAHKMYRKHRTTNTDDRHLHKYIHTQPFQRRLQRYLFIY